MNYQLIQQAKVLSFAALLGLSSVATANIYDFQNKATGFTSDNAHFSLLGMANNSVLAHENSMFSIPIDDLNQQGRSFEVISDNNAVTGVFNQNELFVYVNEVDEDVAVTVRVVSAANVMATEFSLTINVVNKPTLAIDTYAAPQFVSADLGGVIVGETKQWLTGIAGNTYLGNFTRRTGTITNTPIASGFTQNNAPVFSLATGTPSGQLIPVINRTNTSTPLFFASNNIAESFIEQPIEAAVPLALISLGKEKAALLAKQAVERMFRQENTDSTGGSGEEESNNGSVTDNNLGNLPIGGEEQQQGQGNGGGDQGNSEDAFNNRGSSTGESGSQDPVNQNKGFVQAPNFSDDNTPKPTDVNIEVVKISEPHSFGIMLLALITGLFMYKRRRLTK